MCVIDHMGSMPPDPLCQKVLSAEQEQAKKDLEGQIEEYRNKLKNEFGYSNKDCDGTGLDSCVSAARYDPSNKPQTAIGLTWGNIGNGKHLIKLYDFLIF